MPDDTPHPQAPPRTWQCQHCDATVSCDFAICWRCGATRDGEADPDFQPEVAPVQDEAHCEVCGYSLRSLTTNRCPECGTIFDPDHVDTLIEGPGPPTTTIAQALAVDHHGRCGMGSGVRDSLAHLTRKTGSLAAGRSRRNLLRDASAGHLRHGALVCADVSAVGIGPWPAARWHAPAWPAAMS